jgi:phenylalanyl-tRNA synthetase beta chain
MKGILESWLDSADLKNLRCEAAEHNAFKKTACASIAYDNKILLHFGEVDKKWLKGIRLRAPLFIALIDLQAVLDIKTAAKKYQELPLFPGTARDITLVAAPGLTHQDILDTISELKLPILESVELVDVFEDEKVLGKGRRSMTYSISFCNPQRTLKDDEVNQMQEKIRKELQNKLKVELR